MISNILKLLITVNFPRTNLQVPGKQGVLYCTHGLYWKLKENKSIRGVNFQFSKDLGIDEVSIDVSAAITLDNRKYNHRPNYVFNLCFQISQKIWPSYVAYAGS
jgi:hypothetical protein